MTDDIILKFTNADLLIDDSAYKKLIQQENSLQLADSLIEDISSSNDDVFVLTGAIVDQYLQRNLVNQSSYNYSMRGILKLMKPIRMLLTVKSCLKAN